MKRGTRQGKTTKKKLKSMVSSAVDNNLKVTNEAFQALVESQQAILAAISSHTARPDNEVGLATWSSSNKTHGHH